MLEISDLPIRPLLPHLTEDVLPLEKLSRTVRPQATSREG
jgi:hypothetical protein